MQTIATPEITRNSARAICSLCACAHAKGLASLQIRLMKACQKCSLRNHPDQHSAAGISKVVEDLSQRPLLFSHCRVPQFISCPQRCWSADVGLEHDIVGFESANVGLETQLRVLTSALRVLMSALTSLTSLLMPNSIKIETTTKLTADDSMASSESICVEVPRFKIPVYLPYHQNSVQN